MGKQKNIHRARLHLDAQSRAISRQDGFTLVELLMTVVVSVILIGSLSVVVNNNAFLAKKGRNLTVANSYAENKIEEIRSKGFLSLENGVANITTDMPTELPSPRSGSIEVSDTAVTGLKQITLNITYNDVGTQKTHTYKTYIGELGVAQY